MRCKAKIYLILFIFLAGLGLSHYAPVLMAKTHQPKDANYLFVQTASHGRLDMIPGQPGYYMLQLSELYPYITAFTDRPERKVKLLSMTQFLSQWNQGQDNFSKDAPNANLSVIKLVNNEIQPQDITLELINKKYDVKQNQMTYTVHILGNETISTPLMFSYSTLFVDGCCCINC